MRQEDPADTAARPPSPQGSTWSFLPPLLLGAILLLLSQGNLAALALGAALAVYGVIGFFKSTSGVNRDEQG